MNVNIHRLIELSTQHRHVADRSAGTYGIIQVDGWRCWTSEPVWQGNERFFSCIPEGVYALEPHNGSKYSGTYAVVGNGVTHFEEPGSVRYSIVLHAAHSPIQLQGCIAPSLGLEWQEGLPVLVKSAKALAHLVSLLNRDEQHTLLITRD